MTYDLLISKKADKKLKKHSRDKKFIEAVNKKVSEILENPEHYKPLRGDMHGSRRAHVQSSYVIVYEIDGNIVRLLDIEHHDKVYLILSIFELLIKNI
ncbi:mRNA interferase RelE/StbE/toxin YoeB [Methanococcus maripaludis]|uniref:mRNA interferase RelE/StbE/toxin YoeB n=1 Tax=Methanococcus maripaludis TaxID=39152 RepID=A0A7J9PCP1_METMI|nr:type II toxin-antitoxin system mRNA interferase toxin, RelE/StbE family [Methanococcus maripaludis]MBA2840956.1 mRNA interferase RelE/StbE/toxin YoeB [Methanococcus maripaludis]MBA2853509.1 mRNA interferase RelE/StbE/toxin YoeB [Methanococcus maripaludis]MBA2860848.1 mRNA interferase RelE/StbE/toxin YoeB [Methanococcus maripaludis]MBA2861015.1 mRNA interferase RelE/StbE/toxin YoeB [Methanococcus maripaludis]MBA2868836.1 mRNA interferase RelE/StbE/toxin YoeB [Methanococcus maripaludis]